MRHAGLGRRRGMWLALLAAIVGVTGGAVVFYARETGGLRGRSPFAVAMSRAANRERLPALSPALVEPDADSPPEDLPVEQDARLRVAAGAPRDAAALAHMLRADHPSSDEPAPPALPVVGESASFWVVDALEHRFVPVTATLTLTSTHALFYVDGSIRLDGRALRDAAAHVDTIYERIHQLFGSERIPGIDGDARVTILLTRLRGAGGYFSTNDQLSRSVNPYSNQRDMIVVDALGTPPGTQQFFATLAHELQHLVHAAQAPNSPTWFDEGLATLAEDLAGYGSNATAQVHLRQPDISLTGWADNAAQVGSHYGTVRLFMRYFYEQYAGDDGLRDLLAEDAGNWPERMASIAARRRPDIASFGDLVADWAVANLVNDARSGDGRYGYGLLPGTVGMQQLPDGQATVQQFAADYLGPIIGPSTVRFAGSVRVGIGPERPRSGQTMWWSGRGDNRVATLTRAFDLRAAQNPVLRFWMWFELERSYDYAYLSISTDNGETWELLRGTRMTDANETGQNLGVGWNGVSGRPGARTGQGEAQWVEEQVDLQAYAGAQILVRFWVVTDQGFQASGLFLDDMQLSAAGWEDDTERDEGWVAEGFVRTSGVLEQTWELRRVALQDGVAVVEPVAVDASGVATVSVASGDRAALVVVATTAFTDRPGRYILSDVAREP